MRQSLVLAGAVLLGLTGCGQPASTTRGQSDAHPRLRLWRPKPPRQPAVTLA
jgi:hypothetical protein